jgi:hypothetical protein
MAIALKGMEERDAVVRRDLEQFKALVEKQRDEVAALRQENALLRQRVEDHLKHVEEWDRRRWGLIVLLIGTILSLASGLIVTLARK